jgi:excisionase family DNA binding protein
MKTEQACLYLSAAELCARWGISRPTLERALRNGSMPLPIRLGGRRWLLAEIEAHEAQLSAGRTACRHSKAGTV